jgi:hypothetical protein
MMASYSEGLRDTLISYLRVGHQAPTSFFGFRAQVVVRDTSCTRAEGLLTAAVDHRRGKTV